MALPSEDRNLTKLAGWLRTEVLPLVNSENSQQLEHFIGEIRDALATDDPAVAMETLLRGYAFSVRLPQRTPPKLAFDPRWELAQNVLARLAHDEDELGTSVALVDPDKILLFSNDFEGISSWSWKDS